eukprot:6183560-Pleurochrysis_carterae.AAC.2
MTKSDQAVRAMRAEGTAESTGDALMQQRQRCAKDQALLAELNYHQYPASTKSCWKDTRAEMKGALSLVSKCLGARTQRRRRADLTSDLECGGLL